jgi:hypothetical protein
MTRFHETQRLQPHFRWLVAFPPAMFTALAVAQRWLGHPIGPHALSDRGFASVSIALWLVYVWLSRVQLVTDVDATSVSVRMRGLSRHHRISLSTIRSASVVTFDSDRDFGGQGFRTIKGGRAYVATSTRGVNIKLDGGGFVVIGSARPEELAAAVAPTPGDSLASNRMTSK